MDQFDLKLLDCVQKDNRLTADQLSDLVGLSSSACQRRLKKLRADKVIEGDVSIISPEAVGRQLTMIVQVTLVREQPDLIDSFKRSMRNTPEVMQCYYVTGEHDFVLILTVADMSAYEDFSRRFFFENSNIQRFNTIVVMDRVKAGFQVPLWTRE
ncbi:MAG: Lrp/AsnC family transcriptional regulator [Alphaproteobacteria bacterium]|jgi:Lrp/AsnC family leucine-responsive transcriptional regulator|nr:Lrp/AsnC family transcriptional regulator [Alphaproteobacteria bacterium]